MNNGNMNSHDTVLLGQRIKSEKYTTYEDRLQTYHHWPKQMKQNKYALARAGFVLH